MSKKLLLTCSLYHATFKLKPLWISSNLVQNPSRHLQASTFLSSWIFILYSWKPSLHIQLMFSRVLVSPERCHRHLCFTEFVLKYFFCPENMFHTHLCKSFSSFAKVSNSLWSPFWSFVPTVKCVFAFYSFVCLPHKALISHKHIALSDWFLNTSIALAETIICVLFINAMFLDISATRHMSDNLK